MKQAIRPYLHFDENCKEAMQFYRSIFGGQLDMMQIKDAPDREQFPKDIDHQIMHASLRNDDFVLMASDMCGQGSLNQGNSMQLSLNCSDEKEINQLYQKLSEGGKITQELNEVFWGGLFAMVTDKFGVRWMLSFENK